MKSTRLIIALFLLLLLTACGREPEPTTPAATATTPPTSTPAPTATPAATPTSVATLTTAPSGPTAPETADSCASPEVAALVARLQEALAGEDKAALAELIHPEKGLTVRMAWWNPPVTFSGPAVENLLADETSHDWGAEDGSGFAITGSFAEVALPALQEDLLEATEIGCGEILAGATAGLVQLPPEDEGLSYVSLYRPAPEGEIEFDWGTWVAGYEEWQGEVYLTTLIHYAYEI